MSICARSQLSWHLDALMETASSISWFATLQSPNCWLICEDPDNFQWYWTGSLLLLLVPIWRVLEVLSWMFILHKVGIQPTTSFLPPCPLALAHYKFSFPVPPLPRSPLSHAKCQNRPSRTDNPIQSLMACCHFMQLYQVWSSYEGVDWARGKYQCFEVRNTGYITIYFVIGLL